MNIVYVADGVSDYIFSCKIVDEGTLSREKITVGGIATGIAVNPNTNLIYVANKLGYISIIDSYTNSIIRNITVGNSPTGIAINPNNNMIYVTNLYSNYVNVINGTTDKIVANVTVGNSPVGIAVNPSADVVYVTNKDPNANIVHIISTTTNMPVVGIYFKIDPPNSGYINCNGANITSIANSTYVRVDHGPLTCIFPSPVSYWSVFPPIFFDSWSGDLASPDSDRDHIITFKPTQFGTLVANFYVLSDAYITTILAIAIPAAGALILKYSPFRDWFGQMRRNKNLNKYRILIDDTSKIANYDKKDHIQLFEEIRKRIVDLYLNGNISDSQYADLNDEISAAMKKIKSS